MYILKSHKIMGYLVLVNSYTHLGNNCTVEIGIFPSSQKIGLAICETKPKVACTLPIKIERLDIHSNIITVKYSIKAVNWPCCAQPAYKSSYAPACNTFTEQHSVYK